MNIDQNQWFLFAICACVTVCACVMNSGVGQLHIFTRNLWVHELEYVDSVRTAVLRQRHWISRYDLSI